MDSSIRILFFLMLITNCTNCLANNGKPYNKKILFIGNSLTYYNSMPQTLQKIFDEQKVNIRVDQQTFGGAMLCEHAWYVVGKDFQRHRAKIGEISNGVKKILSQKWDYIVLQDAGSNVLNTKYVELSLEPSLIFLDSIIKSINAKCLLFEDYTGQIYPKQICISNIALNSYLAKNPNLSFSNHNDIEGDFCSIKIQNSNDEYALINVEYERMSKKLHSDLVKVGYAFQTFKTQNPLIPIYQSSSDDHPSSQGSYLIACLFFKKITGKSLKNIRYRAGLNSREAKIIRQFADTIK